MCLQNETSILYDLLHKHYTLYACTYELKTNRYFLCCSARALTRRYKPLTKYSDYLLANENDSV